MDTLWHIREECLGDLLVAWVFLEVDWNEQLSSLLVDVSHINTTLVVEEDPVTLQFWLDEIEQWPKSGFLHTSRAELMLM